MNALPFFSALGTLLLAEEADCLVRIDLPGFFRALPSGCRMAETPLLLRACRELAEYFRGERREFTLPFAPHGTDFQRLAWRALCGIPYGETRTYRQQAEAMGHPRAFRAVGGANHRNPLAIVIPCHRVIGSDGSLTGYGGGLDVKARLLRLEQTGVLLPCAAELNESKPSRSARVTAMMRGC